MVLQLCLLHAHIDKTHYNKNQVTLSMGYSQKDWRLQAICCLSVAAKYEEAERNMPMVSEMAAATELRLTTSMITAGELSLARGFGWDVSRVTAMHFLSYYLHQGVTFANDECQVYTPSNTLVSHICTPKIMLVRIVYCALCFSCRGLST
jgi:Cyclin, N-terminal domain